MKDFPKDFLWGASTSAYQVEGGLHTQWSEWEEANAHFLTKEVPKRFAWIPNAEQLKGKWDDAQNYISDNGIEHYQRYETDFDILQQLHMNAFRFSIEWARLEPEEGVWDEAALEHYRRYIAGLKRRGIEPILTLWHWTMPVWFTNKGGFEKRSNLRYFERYVNKIAEEFSNDLSYVLTLNEPNVYASISYMAGDWPPNSKSPYLTYRVYRNLMLAHRQAYQSFKKLNPKIQIGVPMNLGNMYPKNPHNPVNRVVASLLSWLWNWWFLGAIRNYQDFIGVNYYFTDYRDWRGRIRNPKEPVNDLGWYMEPSGLERLLVKIWNKYRKPMIVTESGLADSEDKYRQWWIEESLRAMQRAFTAGVDLRGYLHWSLLDNFEWAYGWWPKFGLVAVDRKTMKRTIRPSARWFAEQIQKVRT